MSLSIAHLTFELFLAYSSLALRSSPLLYGGRDRHVLLVIISDALTQGVRMRFVFKFYIGHMHALRQPNLIIVFAVHWMA